MPDAEKLPQQPWTLFLCYSQHSRCFPRCHLPPLSNSKHAESVSLGNSGRSILFPCLYLLKALTESSHDSSRPSVELSQEPGMAQTEIWMELKKGIKWCLEVPWQPCCALLRTQKGKPEREWSPLAPSAPLGEVSQAGRAPPYTPCTKVRRQSGTEPGRDLRIKGRLLTRAASVWSDLHTAQNPPRQLRTIPFARGLLNQPRWERPKGKFQTPETFGLFSTMKEIAAVQWGNKNEELAE